jgi:hypothetical protein
MTMTSLILCMISVIFLSIGIIRIKPELKYKIHIQRFLAVLALIIVMLWALHIDRVL